MGVFVLCLLLCYQWCSWFLTFQYFSHILLFKHIHILNAGSLQLYSLVDDCSLDRLLSLVGLWCPVSSSCLFAVSEQEDGRNWKQPFVCMPCLSVCLIKLLHKFISASSPKKSVGHWPRKCPHAASFSVWVLWVAVLVLFVFILSPLYLECILYWILSSAILSIINNRSKILPYFL